MNFCAGQRFNRLVAIAKKAEPGPRGATMWEFQCDCGNRTIKPANRVVRGEIKSCGCLKAEILKRQQEAGRKHGGRDTRLYNIWRGMKKRCYVPKAHEYENYGGRGIKVCDEWRNDFAAFRDWALANGYRDDLTIDRIDGDGNYEPSNCRWATYYEQIHNRRFHRQKEERPMIEMTNEMELRIYEALADRYGISGQIVVAVEKLAELQQALTKWLRYVKVVSEGNLNDIRKHIREEIADVNIVLNQMELAFGDTGDIQEQKLQRLYGRVADMFDEYGERKPMHRWWEDEDDG